MKPNYHLIHNLSKQLYLIASTGQSYSAGLLLLESKTTQPEFKKILGQICQDLEHAGLVEALENTAIFDDYYLNTIKSGLYSGNLDQVFLHLATYYQRLEQNNQKLRKMINYPATMSLMMVGVLVVLVTKILPIFDDLYLSIGAKLTGLAQLSLQLGFFINDYFIYVLIALFAIAFAVLLLVRQDKIKIFAPAKELNQTANDLFAFSGLIKSGITFDQAVELTFNQQCGMVEALGSRLEPLELVLLELGLANGTSDKVLAMLVEDYQEKAENKMNEYLEKFELYYSSIFMVVIAVVLLSLILPLFAILAQL